MWTCGSTRAIWAVQDKLALDAEQEMAIEMKREIVNGTERTVWNPALSIPFGSTSSPMWRRSAFKTAIQV